MTNMEKNFRQEPANFIFGLRPVLEAIEAGKEIEKILVQNTLSGELSGELRRKIKENNLVAQYVPIEKLNRLTRKNHQGVIAFISEISYQPISEIIAETFERGEVPLVIILDRITDVRNFGAIARSASCAGVHAIVVPEKGGAPANADAVKTSAGALMNIPVCREKRLKETIDFLKQSGLQIVGCTEKADKLVYDINMSGPTAIIMGSEEDGISGEYLKLCDERVKIPITGEVGSLNVSVAAGVILFESVRHRL